MAKFKRQRDERELTSVRLPPKLKEKCFTIADGEGITFSEWLRDLLRREVKEHQKSA